jgi:alpha-L-fucosidase
MKTKRNYPHNRTGNIRLNSTILEMFAISAALLISLALNQASAAGSNSGKDNAPDTGVSTYTAEWSSVTRHRDPDWFRDAKFGIYFHWGVYSVPAFDNEWYSRKMYLAGSADNKHHLERYGALSKFGYKDFIPQFTGEKFDPDAWAALFTKAGARFAGPVAEHADGFAMWDSKLTKWNAARMGPRRDVVGEMARAIRKQNLKFIATFHHQWLWGWYPTWDKNTDASDPAANGVDGIYGPVVPSATAFGFDHPDPMPSLEFSRYWRDKIVEVINRYQPDLLWFDSRTSIIDEQCRKEFLAYYYNQASVWGREVAVTYKNKDFAQGSGIVDWERGRMARITPYPWIEDDSIDWNSWGYVTNSNYKDARRLVQGLVDVVSKNGCLLLSIGPRADGTIPEAIQERLLDIGAWLRVNGEAIYGTRPFKIFGEGPTLVKEGHFSESKGTEFKAEDIRFTVKGDTLYAISLGWPKDKLAIKSLAAKTPLVTGEIADVSMLGQDEKLHWTRDDTGLIVSMPKRPPCEYAVVLRITGLKDLAWSGGGAK